MSHQFIAIEGVIGVGKTTLARLLQPHFNASILLEVVEDNPFLPRFYQDRERYAFQTQIFFLLSRYQQQYQAVPKALRQGTLISDYTFAKDELFAWLNLKDDELAMYGRVHAALGEKIPRPDLIVYLKADHEVLMRRIALRDRPFERDIDPDYIREVAAAYDAWLSRLNDIPVLVIDTNDLDYLSRPADLEYIRQAIISAFDRIVPVAAKTKDDQLQTLQQGRVAAFQQIHRDLELSEGHEDDLLFKFFLLVQAVGRLSTDLVNIWAGIKQEAQNGHTLEETFESAIHGHRDGLKEELAELMAQLINIANRAGIDLEQAYLDKMRRTIGGAASPAHR